MRASLRRPAIAVAICLVTVTTYSLRGQAQSSASSSKEQIATIHATGPFEVKITAQDDKSVDPTVGRSLITKEYHGDLEGSAKAQMLTAGSVASGSAGYVAIERVTGTLKGRTGSFTLQHSGTMSNRVTQLTVTIVPDSGTGELTGISGKMTINISGGKHTYGLEYTLPKGK